MGKFRTRPRYSYYLILLGLFQGPIAKSLELMEFLTVGATAPSIQNNVDPSQKTQLGFAQGAGISLAFRITEQLEIETTMLYFPRAFSKTDSSGLQSSYSLATLQYPVLAQLWLSERLALGAGAYYSTGVGNLTLTQNSEPHIVGYRDIQLASEELGLTASAQYRWPLNENMSLVGQTRILFGLTNLDQSKNGNIYTKDLQLWCGIGFKL